MNKSAKEKRKCSDCSGDGWYIDHSDKHYENQRFPHDEDCSRYGCPIQRPCETCKGEGYIYDYSFEDQIL